jgi:hypothetical protein
MDNTGRAQEEDLFNMIRSSENRTELLGESHDDDDGSQYLNDHGDGCEAEEEELMFQNLEELTMFGEVYTYILASGDHYMCIN